MKYHRENGPAIEYDNGNCAWYINDEYHREDGPALELYTQNEFRWYLNGVQYSFEYWCEKLNKSQEEISFLRLKYNIYNYD